MRFFLADEFSLDRELQISVDNVYLYIEIVEVINWMPFTIGLSIGMVALVTLITLYEKRWKYSPMVRKARKLKKKIIKGKKKIKPLDINDRKTIMEREFQEQLKVLDLEAEEGIESDKILQNPQKISEVKK